MGGKKGKKGKVITHKQIVDTVKTIVTTYPVITEVITFQVTIVKTEAANVAKWGKVLKAAKAKHNSKLIVKAHKRVVRAKKQIINAKKALHVAKAQKKIIRVMAKKVKAHAKKPDAK